MGWTDKICSNSDWLSVLRFLGVGLVDPRDFLEKVRQSATLHGRSHSAHCTAQEDRTGKVSETEMEFSLKLLQKRVTQGGRDMNLWQQRAYLLICHKN